MTAPPVIAPDPLAALAPPLRWLLQRAAPDEPALALLEPGTTPETLSAAMLQHGQVASVIRLIAAVLPARESVWWAWVSARQATQVEGGVPATAAVHAALAAVQGWIERPSDDARRAVWEAGNVAGLETPTGMVAAAVFLSGTTVGPRNLATVPPPPGAAMPLVSGAILLAAASNSKPDQVAGLMRAFAAQGLEIVKHLDGWDAALKIAHESDLRLRKEYARATAEPSGK